MLMEGLGMLFSVDSRCGTKPANVRTNAIRLRKIK